MCCCCAAAVKTLQSNSTRNRNINTRLFPKISTPASQPVGGWMWNCCLAGGRNAIRSCQRQQQLISLSSSDVRTGTKERAWRSVHGPKECIQKSFGVVLLTRANLLSRRGPGVAARSTHFIRDPRALLWITPALCAHSAPLLSAGGALDSQLSPTGFLFFSFLFFGKRLIKNKKLGLRREKNIDHYFFKTQVAMETHLAAHCSVLLGWLDATRYKILKNHNRRNSLCIW